jgi:hypothetical protein
MEDLLRKGRISRAASLLQLQELRQSLHLEDQDHHRVVRELSASEPRLLTVDGLERQRESLRRDAAQESVEELMQVAGMEVLDPNALSAAQRERLEQIRLNSGVDAEQWDSVLQAAGPEGPRQQELLHHRTEQLRRLRALQVVLAREATADPLVRPLARALELRHQTLEESQPWRPGGPWPQDSGDDDDYQGPADLADALDLLWKDPDPDTAAWVLLLERERCPERVQARLADPRIGLGSSAFLEAMRGDERNDDLAGLPVLASCALFEDLAPAGLLQVAAKGEWRQWLPGQVVLRVGDPSDGSGVVIRGQALVRAPGAGLITLGPGQVLGEMGVISGAPRSADVMAGGEGLELFWLGTAAFETLLQNSRGFTHGVLEQLVERLGSRERRGNPVAAS